MAGAAKGLDFVEPWCLPEPYWFSSAAAEIPIKAVMAVAVTIAIEADRIVTLLMPHGTLKSS
jgi:hypothetical protein